MSHQNLLSTTNKPLSLKDVLQKCDKPKRPRGFWRFVRRLLKRKKELHGSQKRT